MFRTFGARLHADRHPDIVHILGEPAYLSTWQVLRERRRRWPDVPMTTYTAQTCQAGRVAPATA